MTRPFRVSNIQDLISYIQQQPETLAGDQKIASLQQSIDSLKQATNANTKALTDINAPGAMTAYADPFLHTELMSGGDMKYAKYFYQNPPAAPAVSSTTSAPSAPANSNTAPAASSDRPIVIQVQSQVQADQFIASRAQIQRFLGR